jgi:hypothetical protein
MKQTKPAVTRVRRQRSATKDLAARKTGVKAGAVQASYQVLPYIEQRAAGTTTGVSGRIGSLSVDPSDPS